MVGISQVQNPNGDETKRLDRKGLKTFFTQRVFPNLEFSVQYWNTDLKIQRFSTYEDYDSAKPEWASVSNDPKSTDHSYDALNKCPSKSTVSDKSSGLLQSTSKQRSVSTSETKEVVERVMKSVESFIETKTVTSFCIGDKQYCNKDPLYAIYGTASISTCSNGVQATIPQLTVGSVLYMVMGKKNEALSLLGPLAQMGIKDATLSLKVSSESLVELSAHGSPKIVPPGTTQNLFVLFVEKYIETIMFKMSASMLGKQIHL